MKLKKYLAFFSILFLVSLVFIVNNVISGQIVKTQKQRINREITKNFNNKYFRKELPSGHFWISVPEKISSKKPTPVVFLLHGGVFKNVDYGYIFSRLFDMVFKHYNVIFVAPSMPRRSWPKWGEKDKKFIKNVIKFVKSNYRLYAESPIFFGGFSNGAEFALKLTLSGEVKANGIFAFAGGARLAWNNIDVNKDKPIFLSSGYKDGNWIGSTVATYRRLKSLNFTNLTLKGFPEVEHWISPAQAVKLLEWVKENSVNFDYK